ncbi:MAG TPA: phosphodiester glycosidase family protein [Candidatus Tumulicola sp.]
MKFAWCAAALLTLATSGTAFAADVPALLSPPAPFPAILSQAPSIEAVAPGVTYAEYALQTASGPIAVHVVSIDPKRSDVRVGEVQARDALESHGETVGSMAKRTGAVAGINGDYFDIGNTNRPTNVVVRDGQLLSMPRKRYALAIERDGAPQIVEFSFTGTVSLGASQLALAAVNELPVPGGGAGLLTPEFGAVPPEDNLTLIAMAPLSGGPSPTQFRVVSIADNSKRQPAGYYLAIGMNAYGSLDVPSVGDTATVSGDLAPFGLSSLVTAIGGGPLILHEGRWYDDPDGPRGGEYSRRIPASGAAVTADGHLLLIEVDGRHPASSVGVTRREFAALMRGLGATEGMAFDGGGSSTEAVRRVGDLEAEIVNKPSDGFERPVGNGLFVYSTDPVGPPVRIVARPGIVRALPSAQVALRFAAVDAANHVSGSPGNLVAGVEPPSLGIVSRGVFVAQHPGHGRIVIRDGALHGEVAVEVWPAPDRIGILPRVANVERGGSIDLDAVAIDARGYALAAPPSLKWSTTSGRIDSRGRFVAGSGNATVSVEIGGVKTSMPVTVGSHTVDIGFAQRARFSTIPHGGGGSLTRGPCATCLTLNYAFGPGERAAYAMANAPLPEGVIGVAFDVLDDGSGGRLRMMVRNSINETSLVDAAPLGTPGWRHVVVRFPADSVPPTVLSAIYILPQKGLQLSNGRIVLQNVRAIVAGQ